MRDDHIEAVRGYYNRRESRIGYALVTRGTKHYGYYPQGVRSSIHRAQRNMELALGSRLALPAGARVFDAGCGEGWVAIHLAQDFGYEVHGVDVLDWSIDKAKRNARRTGVQTVRFAVGDYGRTPFNDHYFDAVYTMETLVHAEDYRRALAEFWRVLKPGGVVVHHEYVLDDELPERDEHAWRLMFSECPMPTFKAFRVSKVAGIWEQAGFRNVVVRDETARIEPMMRRFYQLGWVPYQVLKLMGQEERHVNTFAAVRSWELRRQIHYGIVRATKPR